MHVCFLDKLEDRVRDVPSEYLAGHDLDLVAAGRPGVSWDIPPAE